MQRAELFTVRALAIRIARFAHRCVAIEGNKSRQVRETIAACKQGRYIAFCREASFAHRGARGRH